MREGHPLALCRKPTSPRSRAQKEKPDYLDPVLSLSQASACNLGPFSEISVNCTRRHRESFEHRIRSLLDRESPRPLTAIESGIEGLDVSSVPRGIYLENGRRKMRAIFKFPALERAIQVDALDRRTDRLCPLIKVSNSLAGTSKIMIDIGAFSFATG